MAIQELLTGAQDAMTVRRVYGEPYEKDGAVLIPAAAVRGGGGGGGGGGFDPEGTRGEGEGGGFGLSARPVGAFVIRDGDATWVPAIDATRIAVLGNVVAVVVAFFVYKTLKARAKRR